MRGRQRRKLDGVLLLDKPVGPSSSAVLQAVKRLLEADKAGHAGTLDPLASGLLPLLFGEATKFAQFGLDSIKEYVAQIRLGTSTDTGDAEGQVVERRAVTSTTRPSRRRWSAFAARSSRCRRCTRR